MSAGINVYPGAMATWRDTSLGGERKGKVGVLDLYVGIQTDCNDNISLLDFQNWSFGFRLTPLSHTPI